jgi:hypothetical protein
MRSRVPLQQGMQLCFFSTCVHTRMALLPPLLTMMILLETATATTAETVMFWCEIWWEVWWEAALLAVSWWELW